MANVRRIAQMTRRSFLKWGLAISTLAGLSGGGYAPLVVRGEGSFGRVGDVVDFALESREWPGDFGYVTFRLQRGFYDCQQTFFIRTDCSDRSFAEEQGLRFVPRLRQALGVQGVVGDLYLFKEDIVGDRGYRPLPVLSTVPGQPDYSPLFRVHFITEAKFPELLVSVKAIEASVRVGEAKVETTDIVVNYPVVRWPVMTPSPEGTGGYVELPHDTTLEEYLGGGQLIRPVDLLKQTVTFKLQKCFPNFRYIVTDVSMADPAAKMNIAYSPGLARLWEARKALARVFVFGNGIPGGGPMGFQSSIMDPKVTSNFWSPLWEHFTVLWQDPAKAVLITDERELRRRLDRGELERFIGTPATHPQGFVVNCPIPVVEG